MNPMLRRLFILLSGLLAATLTFGAPIKGVTKAPASSFERTKARITELLGLRQNPVPLPAVLANPFSSTASSTPTSDAGPGTPATPPEPVSLLTRLAQALKISGTIQLGGKPSLIINSAAYGEGDVVPFREGETVHRLRIKQITNTHVTFELDGEETTIPLR